MKKFACLTLMLSLCSLKLALADESAVRPELIPATSLEEMINSGVDENEDLTDLGHRRDHHSDEVVCFARNRRGEEFESRALDVRGAQERVMKECHRVSLHCFELGCHRD